MAKQSISGNIMEYVSNPKNWKKTHKKGYEVYMCRPISGTQCQNKLEGASYVTDNNKQFILSGTAGETWVIDINKLAKTYTFADGREITPDTLRSAMRYDGQIDWVKLTTRSDATPNYALHLPLSVKNFPVQTSWGDTLLANRDGVGHLKGDFLVCADAGGQPNLNDVWVVNGEIFPKTYDLHAFPNMFNTAILYESTKYPTSNFTTSLSDIGKNAGSTIVNGEEASVASDKFKVKSEYDFIMKAFGLLRRQGITVSAADFDANFKINSGAVFIDVYNPRYFDDDNGGREVTIVISSDPDATGSYIMFQEDFDCIRSIELDDSLFKNKDFWKKVIKATALFCNTKEDITSIQRKENLTFDEDAYIH